MSYSNVKKAMFIYKMRIGSFFVAFYTGFYSNNILKLDSTQRELTSANISDINQKSSGIGIHIFGLIRIWMFIGQIVPKM